MKYLLTFLTKLTSKMNSFLKNKKTTIQNKNNDFSTNDHDWEQYNDNVSF